MMTTAQHDLPVGKRIRWARKQRGLSQERLAGAIGTTRQVVIRWEAGKHLPNASSRARLGEVLGHEAGFFSENGSDDEDEDSELTAQLLFALRGLIRAERERTYV